MLHQYFNEESGRISFTRKQGSDFAKLVANDYNPLHNTDAKKFCVPGDLLFALLIEKYGVKRKMHFSFEGMVTEHSLLELPQAADELEISQNDKVYLRVNGSGEGSNCSVLKDSLISHYVAFSGTTFPHILVPVMAEKGMMINPVRPMVMYQSMSFELDSLGVVVSKLRVEKATFDFDGKRGNVILPFSFIAKGEKVVGRGEKKMLVSGLKAYCETSISCLIENYNEWKQRQSA